MLGSPPDPTTKCCVQHDDDDYDEPPSKRLPLIKQVYLFAVLLSLPIDNQSMCSRSFIQR